MGSILRLKTELNRPRPCCQLESCLCLRPHFPLPAATFMLSPKVDFPTGNPAGVNPPPSPAAIFSRCGYCGRTPTNVQPKRPNTLPYLATISNCHPPLRIGCDGQMDIRCSSCPKFLALFQPERLLPKNLWVRINRNIPFVTQHHSCRNWIHIDSSPFFDAAADGVLPSCHRQGPGEDPA